MARDTAGSQIQANSRDQRAQTPLARSGGCLKAAGANDRFFAAGPIPGTGPREDAFSGAARRPDTCRSILRMKNPSPIYPSADIGGKVDIRFTRSTSVRWRAF